MKQQLYDKEARLDCVCGEPYHFIYFGFNKPRQSDWAGFFSKEEYAIPELVIWTRYIKGAFWNRVKNAWKYIVKGSYTEESETEIEGWDEIEKLRDFLNECLQSKKGE